MSSDEKVAKLEALLARVKANSAQPRATWRTTTKEAPKGAAPAQRDLKSEAVGKVPPRDTEATKSASDLDPSSDTWLDELAGVVGFRESPEAPARAAFRASVSSRDPAGAASAPTAPKS